MRSRFSISFIVAFGFVLGLEGTARAQSWQSPALWHRSLKKPVRGTLIIDAGGTEFQSAKFTERWPNLEIRSFDLASRDFTLFSYQNRRWHEPGERQFHFTLSEPVPPEVAAQLTAQVGRPVRNGVPVSASTAFAEIPAHHRLYIGGSNGILRLKDDGVDYVTEDGRDSRTWRWDDIQTLANPNPYEFRVTGFRETAEFDLKQPLDRALFERTWDRLYTEGLNLKVSGGEAHHQ